MEQKAIHLAMQRIMAAVDPIGKDRENKGQKFNYRGVDDVMNALHPLFVSHNVILTWDIISSEHSVRHITDKPMAFTTLTIRYTFTCTIDGSSMSTTTIGAAGDTYDKDTSKAQAMALKYLLYHTFLIETGEEDPDGDTPTMSAKAATEKQINYLRTLATKADGEGKISASDGVAIRAVIKSGNADDVDRWIKQLKL